MAASVASYTWAAPGSNPQELVTQAGAPTAAVAQYINELIIGLIATVDGDTNLAVTHNWNLNAAQQALLIGVPQALGTPGQLSAWYVSAVTANGATLTKSTTGGSGAAGPAAQANMVLLKPTTLMQ